MKSSMKTTKRYLNMLIKIKMKKKILTKLSKTKIQTQSCIPKNTLLIFMKNKDLQNHSSHIAY